MTPRLPTAACLVSSFGLIFAVCWSGVALVGRPLDQGTAVRGWTILSGSEAGAREVIAAAPKYGVNQIELSQEIVNDLRDLRDGQKLALVRSLSQQAHDAGVTEVVVWDHPLYELDYYPTEFRTGPGRTLDLDNPAFWEWFKADYRSMLDRIPQADGVVLTFIGTAGHAERQASKTLLTDGQKLAAVVDAVADVVIGERHLNLYVRLFPNDQARDPGMIDPINRIRRPEVRLMIKQTPLDYFLTVPPDTYVGTFARPTVVEFDLVGEFNGQGMVPNTFIEDILGKWRDLGRRPNVIGYSVRTDRLRESRLVGTPGEMNLLALKMASDNPQVTAEQVYDEFLDGRYGKAALPEVKAAFKNAFDIVTSSFYVLGTPLSDHSNLDFDHYTAPYGHLVSGRWIDPPIAYVGHGVNREFHYWRDVVDHIAPPFTKESAYSFPDFVVPAEIRAWLHPGERMDEEYLHYILTEKNFGVALTEDSLAHIENARSALTPEAYAELHALFERTWLTVRLRRAAAMAYYGFRVWCRGPEFRTPYVTQAVQDGLTEMKEVSSLIRTYPAKPRSAQFVWAHDAEVADGYFRCIVEDGWPVESGGIKNANGGMRFPYVTRLASDRIVLPRLVVDNPKIRMLRWVLAPGEGTEVRGHALDSVMIVIRGSRLKGVTTSGTSEADRPSGYAAFLPANATADSIANAGDSPFECVTVELKCCPTGKGETSDALQEALPPNQARLVTGNVVPPVIVAANSRIKMERWKFAPGDCSPIHGHFLDHVYIVIKGSRIREITGEGKTNDDIQETGRASFSPAHGKIHSFGNVGNEPYEMVSFELR